MQQRTSLSISRICVDTGIKNCGISNLRCKKSGDQHTTKGTGGANDPIHSPKIGF